MTLNFFVITEESIGEILKFFKKYEIATGATINISKKKKLLPLQTQSYRTLIKKSKVYKLITRKLCQNTWHILLE